MTDSKNRQAQQALPACTLSSAEIVAAMASGIGEENINRDVEEWYTRGPILPMDAYGDAYGVGRIEKTGHLDRVFGGSDVVGGAEIEAAKTRLAVARAKSMYASMPGKTKVYRFGKQLKNQKKRERRAKRGKR